MPDELTLEIVTPERVTFKGVVSEVTIPGTEGEFGVLRGHALMLSAVGHGELSYLQDHTKTSFAVHSGYAEVSPAKVTVLVESAERADQIDQERAKRARERAEEKLKRLSKEDREFEKTRLALIRAITRLNVATKG